MTYPGLYLWQRYTYDCERLTSRCSKPEIVSKQIRLEDAAWREAYLKSFRNVRGSAMMAGAAALRGAALSSDRPVRSRWGVGE